MAKQNDKLVTRLFTHLNPDLEALDMVAESLDEKVVQAALSISPTISEDNVSFVEAGQLRKQDLPKGWPLYAYQIEEQHGARFYDCGGKCPKTGRGARHDSHSLDHTVDEGKTTSQDLWLNDLSWAANSHESRLTPIQKAKLREHLQTKAPIFQIIAANDRSGTGVAATARVGSISAIKATGILATLVRDAVAAAEYEEENEDIAEAGQLNSAHLSDVIVPTPWTEQHIRHVVKGWNAQHPKNPHEVLRLYRIARHGMLAATRATQESLLPGQKYNYRELFRLEELIDGVDMYYHKLFRGDDAAAEKASRAFAKSCMDALLKLEAQWERADKDMWAKTTYGESFYMQAQTDDTDGYQVSVVLGRSQSPRFGQRCRVGNYVRNKYKAVRDANGAIVRDENGKVKKERIALPKPQPDQKDRPRANLVIQLYGQGKFGGYGDNGMRLDRVVFGWRIADLILQDVEITSVILAQMQMPGNFAYQNRKGQWVHALYFTTFLSAGGNGFSAKPNAPRCALNEFQIWNIAMAVMRTSYDKDVVEIVHRVLERSGHSVSAA